MRITSAWVAKKCKFAQEFSYSRKIEDLWREVVKGGKDVFSVSFDLENNEDVGDPFSLDVNGNKFVCQPFYASGDWEASVLYYRCQYKESKDGAVLKSFGERIGTTFNSFFVFIPKKEDGNVNLTEKDGGDSWKAADADDREEPDEKRARKALRSWIEECLSK